MTREENLLQEFGRLFVDSFDDALDRLERRFENAQNPTHFMDIALNNVFNSFPDDQRRLRIGNCSPGWGWEGEVLAERPTFQGRGYGVECADGASAGGFED